MSGAQDQHRSRETEPLGEDFFRLRRRRNVAIALALVAFMVLTFVYTIFRLSGTGAAP